MNNETIQEKKEYELVQVYCKIRQEALNGNFYTVIHRQLYPETITDLLENGYKLNITEKYIFISWE